MRSVRAMLVVVPAMLALTLIVPSASAAAPKNFYLDKTCAADATEPLGYVCTVQHSNFRWIPPGTKIHYLSQNAAGDVVQAYIAIKNGSTVGQCVWSVPDFLTAVCTFGPGGGRLAKFHLVVHVTTNADQSIWYWEGTYSFGGRHKNFYLDKTCAADATEPLGYVCTVQHSNFRWIRPGTKIHYLSQNAAGDVVQAYIAIKNGSTVGQCVWSVPDFLTAVCTFGPGGGRLAKFHLVVHVTTNADQSIWYWEGTYWFGGRH